MGRISRGHRRHGRTLGDLFRELLACIQARLEQDGAENAAAQALAELEPVFAVTTYPGYDFEELERLFARELEKLYDDLQQYDAGLKAEIQAHLIDRRGHAFAVYLLAPVAIIVPLTISSAVGANTIVGERERGTGEFLAHSPLSEQEIYLGKLIGSLIPGYLATIVGFALYSLIVNLVVGPQIGGWFFPTAGWWILIFWVVPPFIAMALSVVLRMSARVRSAAAAQQASTLVTLPIILLSYAVSTGLVYSQAASALVVGLVAWIFAYVGLRSGMKAVKRERLLGVASEA